VVSDDLAVRDSIKDMIQAAGMEATMFESLKRYSSEAREHSRDCLVVDTHNVDLKDVGQRAALETICAALPVILITDRGDVATAVRGMKSGAADIVQKPYQETRLLDSLNSAMNVQSLS
jgi:FixJ family two-component response regulator